MSCFEALWQHSAFHGALASVTLGVSQQVRYIPRYYAFRISARRQAQLGWETLGESTMLCGEKKAMGELFSRIASGGLEALGMVWDAHAAILTGSS